MGDLTAPFNRKSSLDMVPVNPSPPARSVPFREDCWSEEATGTLIDAWGRRYLELNRGNLRQKDWQEVADAVNKRHGHSKKTVRTDVQCKNRIDTIKKKYKVEKARVVESNGVVVSAWAFFEKLDVLIGPKKKSEAFTRKTPPGGGRSEAFLRTPPMAIALPRQLPVALAMTPPPPKRGPHVVNDSYFRRNYSMMAAAAAKGEELDDYDEEMSEEEEQSEEMIEERGVKQVEMDGTKMLAKAIDKFAEMYERVEMEKLRQTMELEKKRIEAGREVELQTTKLLSDLQIQLEKTKRAKKKSSELDDIYS